MLDWKQPYRDYGNAWLNWKPVQFVGTRLNYPKPVFQNPMQVGEWLKDKLVYVADKLDSYTNVNYCLNEIMRSGTSANLPEFDCDDFSNLFAYLIKDCSGVSNLKLRNVIHQWITYSHVVCTFTYVDANQAKWQGLYSTDTQQNGVLWVKQDSELSEQWLLDRYKQVYGADYVCVLDLNPVWI